MHDSLPEVDVRELTKRLLADVHFKQVTIDKLTHENAVLSACSGDRGRAVYAGER